MSEILQAFKTRRIELGITQTEIAKRLNISQSQYQKIEGVHFSKKKGGAENPIRICFQE